MKNEILEERLIFLYSTGENAEAREIADLLGLPITAPNSDYGIFWFRDKEGERYLLTYDANLEDPEQLEFKTLKEVIDYLKTKATNQKEG